MFSGIIKGVGAAASEAGMKQLQTASSLLLTILLAISMICLFFLLDLKSIFLRIAPRHLYTTYFPFLILIIWSQTFFYLVWLTSPSILSYPSSLSQSLLIWWYSFLLFPDSIIVLKVCQYFPLSKTLPTLPATTKWISSLSLIKSKSPLWTSLWRLSLRRLSVSELLFLCLY